ncbi:hypothetical protein, partial [Porphyromonas gingivalis]
TPIAVQRSHKSKNDSSIFLNPNISFGERIRESKKENHGISTHFLPQEKNQGGAANEILATPPYLV